MIFATQSPTAHSIPKDLTRNCSNGVAFAVADQVANDGLLGSGKYRAGIRATELRPGEDRGTAVTTGLTANRFELVNGFYLPFGEDRDEVTPVITRAMELLEDEAVPSSACPDNTTADEPEIDHLADIRTALRGEARLRTQIVLQRLSELNPGEYEDWTFQDLAGALAEYDLELVKSHGVKVIHAVDVLAALADRDEDGEGTEPRAAESHWEMHVTAGWRTWTLRSRRSTSMPATFVAPFARTRRAGPHELTSWRSRVTTPNCAAVAGCASGALS